MPFDGLYMRRVIEEINNKVKGPLRNIYQPTKVDYYLQFQDFTVRISLNPTASFLAISEKMKNPSQMPPSFTMLLRKYLKNARFLGVEQDGFSRVAIFKFKRLDEFGDEREYRLVVEIMGKFSNIILVSDENRVIDAHKRIITRKGRELIPGRTFVPFKSEKLDPLKSSIYEIFSEKIDLPIEKFLVKRLEGLSSVLAREIVHRAGFTLSFSAKEINEKRMRMLEDALEEIRKEYSDGRCYVLYESSKPVDISPVILKHTGFEHHEKSPSDAVVELYGFKESEDILKNKKRDLEKVVVKEIDKFEEIVRKIKTELEKVENFERFKKWAELLISNSYSIDTSNGKVEVMDWESGEKVSIEVDPRKSALDNAKSFFEKYKKLKRKKEGMLNRLRELGDHISYLYQLWQTILDSEEPENLEEIRDEMEEVRIIRRQKRKRKERRRSYPRKVELYGFVILIGKNNRQNDDLVRSSSPSDIWLHAKGIPGAHVIIKTGGKEVPEAVLKYAASLAAGYSRGRDSGKVPVDYTLVKYVRKPKGFKPGMVIYEKQKTIVVEPRRLER
jgi:predicted ribosome quality control (RQC) complex YloA/Tae2 family protein